MATMPDQNERLTQPSTPIATPRILLIDSYDSFTFNLAALCRQAIPGCYIYIIKNDSIELSKFLHFIQFFSAIIIGPGPGSPASPEAVGIINDVWKSVEIPIFGVCFGLQSLAYVYGGEIRRLATVKHGLLSKIQHSGTGIFQGAGDFEAVRYHSLHVHIREPVRSSPLEVIAWTDDHGAEGRVIMALKHRNKPFWAVQYHPESTCTRGGVTVITNFWILAQEWDKVVQREREAWNWDAEQIFGKPWPQGCLIGRNLPYVKFSVTTLEVHSLSLSTTDICERIHKAQGAEFVLLDSAAKPGRHSIIGVLSDSSIRVVHNIGDCFLTLSRSSVITRVDLSNNVSIWDWLAKFMSEHQATDGSPNSPFWGGIIGMLSYELGVNDLNISAANLRTQLDNGHPDLNLVFVERSIVRDEQDNVIYVQSLKAHDDNWLQSTLALLESKDTSGSPHLSDNLTSITERVTLPDQQLYIARINLAKEHIYAGDSYELCLTARTRVVVPANCDRPSAWARYKSLRQRNPAAHAAYLCLSPTTLLAASPERFLSISRNTNPVCQLRPIKGTLRKDGVRTSRSVAEQMLRGSEKEVAENLMIVDLIRHDLHSVVGENVQVSQFCVVEESETVWSLVSVIEGSKTDNTAGPSFSPRNDMSLCWEVLSKSLPPGSMTGAPKKRSVEILQVLEESERSIYSGIFGYACAGGGADWAVMIRSCFKHDTTDESVEGDEEWIIGAGGAITALSDPKAEFDEMITKVQSALGAFQLET